MTLVMGCNDAENAKIDIPNEDGLTHIQYELPSNDNITSLSVNEVYFDWEQYKASMDGEHFSALLTYIPLFEENKKFYYYPINDDCSLLELKTRFKTDGYIVRKFALVDMNEDGEKELIANFDLGPGLTFVFTIIDEKYYGSFFSAREMRELQANGNFSGSGGAADIYFNRLYITREEMRSYSFAEKHGWGDECNWTNEYYEEFIKENYSNPAEWYEMNYVVE